MESAIIDENTRLIETQDECPGLTAVAVGAWKQLVRAVVAGCVEDVITSARVVVGVAVDPFHTVAGPDREREGKKAVFLRNDHLLGAAFLEILGVSGPGCRDDDRGNDAQRETKRHGNFLS